jgi:hypothetical protein
MICNYKWLVRFFFLLRKYVLKIAYSSVLNINVVRTDILVNYTYRKKIDNSLKWRVVWIEGKMEVLKLKINLENPGDVCYLKVPRHWFVYLSFVFGHCIVGFSLIRGYRLPLWYLQIFLFNILSFSMHISCTLGWMSMMTRELV